MLSELPAFFSDFLKLFGDFEALGESALSILKIIGIGYIFGISSDVCRELGEAGISSALSLIGRFEAIAVALPFIAEIFSLALSLV